MRRIGVLLHRSCGRCGISSPPRGIPAGAAAIGLDRRPQRADRHPLGHGRCRRIRRHAAELVALAPDVILAARQPDRGGVAAGDPHRADRVRDVADPVGAGFVDSLARPGGNATGFMTFEYSMSGKWLELLKEIAPSVTRVAVLRDPAIASGTGQFGAIQAVAPSLGVEVSPVNVRDAGEIERAVAAFARSREWRSDRDGERVGDASSRSDHRSWRPGTSCPRSTSNASSSPPAA